MSATGCRRIKKTACSREGGSPSPVGESLNDQEMGQYRVDHAPHGQGSSGGRSAPILLRGDTRFLVRTALVAKCALRSETLRVGKGRVSTCHSMWSPYH